MECTKQIQHEHFLKIDGQKIKIARVGKNWTLSKLEEMSGVTRKTIAAIEKGSKKKIRYSTIEQIAITLGKPIEYFCSRIEKNMKEV